MAQARYYKAQGYEIIEYTNKPFHYTEHNHVSVFTLGLVLDGLVTLKIDNTSIDYLHDSFFIIPPLKTHELILPETYTLLTICFDYDFAVTHTSSQIRCMLNRSSKRLAQANGSLLQEALDALCEVVTAAEAPTALSGSAKTLHMSPEAPLSIGKIAKADHLSKFHFIRKFKRFSGLTPHRFVLQSRVRKAQQLIENGMPLADVALTAGFFDQSHFTKCFKKAVGLTPLEYKQACRTVISKERE